MDEIPEEIWTELKQNLENSFSIYEDASANSERLERFKETWECEDPIEFLHGWMVGEISGEAFAYLRTRKGKKLSAKESERLANIIKSYKLRVKDIISRMKQA